MSREALKYESISAALCGRLYPMLCATVAALTWTITMLLCSLHDTHTCPAGTTLVMMPTAGKQTEDVARHFMDVRVFQERYDRGHNLTILILNFESDGPVILTKSQNPAILRWQPEMDEIN